MEREVGFWQAALPNLTPLINETCGWKGWKGHAQIGANSSFIDSLEFIFWGINDAGLALMNFFIAVAAAAATVIPPCVVGSFVCTPSRARPANSWMASAK